MVQTVSPEKALHFIAQVLETSPGLLPETRDDLIAQAKIHLAKVLEKKSPHLGLAQFGVPKSVNATLLSIASPELMAMAMPHLEDSNLNKHLEFNPQDHFKSPDLPEICLFWARAIPPKQFGNYALDVAVKLAQKQKVDALKALTPLILDFEDHLDYPSWPELGKDLQAVSQKVLPLVLPLALHALSHKDIAHRACADDVAHNTCFASFIVLRCHPHLNPFPKILQTTTYKPAVHGMRAPATAHLIATSQSAHKMLRLQQDEFDPILLLDAHQGSFVKNLSRVLDLPSHKEAKKLAKRQRQIENGRFN